jgi:hypothetical protein
VNRQCNVTKRIQTRKGPRYCPVVLSANGRIKPDLVLQGTNLLCGGTGNCQLFVFRKANDKWVSLFGGHRAPLAESFQLGPSVTRGIKDLTVVTNASADSSERVSYKFDGQFYRSK